MSPFFYLKHVNAYENRDLEMWRT